MKTIIVIVLSFIWSSVCLPLNNTDTLVKAEIIPNLIYDGTLPDSLNLVIENNSGDTLVFSTDPYFAFGNFLESINNYWFWQIKSFSNVLFFDDLKNRLSFSGDGNFSIKFNSITKLLCISPKSKLIIVFFLNDFLKDYCKSKEINIYAFLSYGIYNEICQYLKNDNMQIDKLKSKVLYEKQFSANLISFKDLDQYNEKPQDEFIDALIKHTFKYGVNVERK